MAEHTPESPIYNVVVLLKAGQLKEIRSLLGLSPDLVTDNILRDTIIALEQGLSLFVKNRQPEARQYLSKALPILKKSTNAEIKLFAYIVTDLAEGISRLLNGDADGALKHLELTSQIVEKLSFFVPGMKKTVISCKALCYTALARKAVNAGNIDDTKLWFGKMYDQYRQLEALLNPEDPVDITAYSEIYASRLEVANFLASQDLYVLNLEDMERQLHSVADDVTKLSGLVNKIQPGPIQDITKGFLFLNLILNDLHALANRIVLNRASIGKAEIEKFQKTGQNLFEAEELAQRAGERGVGLLAAIKYLKKLHKNLLLAGKVRKRDFIIPEGIVFLSTLIILIILIHFTVRPSGQVALLFFLGEFIVSLIVAFGYGALRFKSLLKLYSQAFKL
jgi:hypothetical protein